MKKLILTALFVAPALNLAATVQTIFQAPEVMTALKNAAAASPMNDIFKDPSHIAQQALDWVYGQGAGSFACSMFSQAARTLAEAKRSGDKASLQQAIDSVNKAATQIVKQMFKG
jgi:hypothetical protein